MLKTNLPAILKDNDAAYLEYVENNLRVVDELCEITVIQKLNSIGFHIKPSHNILKQPLIKAVLKMHNDLGILIDLSKTITTSGFINFAIPFEDEGLKKRRV